MTAIVMYWDGIERMETAGTLYFFNLSCIWQSNLQHFRCADTSVRSVKLLIVKSSQIIRHHILAYYGVDFLIARLLTIFRSVHLHKAVFVNIFLNICTNFKWVCKQFLKSRFQSSTRQCSSWRNKQVLVKQEVQSLSDWF